MIDRDTVSDGPFEIASNAGFILLLLSGIGLLAGVAVVGRSPIAILAVGLYLLAIPCYVAIRLRIWDGEESDDDEADGNDSGDGPADSDRAAADCGGAETADSPDENDT
ncbi:hypothetical protein [Natrinema salifodinae]|uniref:Uncharacterized protein n=1 Tax=Natrinema salifodinae TaxID=1202768 RepID=A0A1I0M975_9EURY|nr:hypothetical protein [Natrinema salifodinae]SEV84678.1 hypothetical protein SAMN05216285_0635 [Natrinema salifodinae]